MSEADARAVMVNANRRKRLITPPQEVATAAAWLYGAASGSINGQNIEIAGGQM